MLERSIDLVVTYVDCRDFVWQKNVVQFKQDFFANQFRSWDMLKFWFRGVEKFMPWIRTVHLVVSNNEQVPLWLDQSKVHVMLHQDIIPKKLLPTFNSTTIEMFLHKIPGLAEHFVYSNDDMFAVASIDSSYFFRDGMPVYDVNYAADALSGFKFQCKKSCQLARKLTRKTDDGKWYFYPKHSMTAMLKSVYEEVHSKAGDKIIGKCSKFRAPVNYTQYLFPDYALLAGKGIAGRQPSAYVGANDIQRAVCALKSGKWPIVCVNDNAKVEDFEKSKEALAEAFESIFPERSKFENG